MGQHIKCIVDIAGPEKYHGEIPKGEYNEPGDKYTGLMLLYFFNWFMKSIFEDLGYPMQPSPYEESPVRPMPEPAEEEGEEKVTVSFPGTASAAA